MNLITDRTEEDVQLAREILAAGGSTEDLKGAYNASDANRVESAVQELHEHLEDVKDAVDEYREAAGVAPAEIFETGIDLETITVKTDWNRADRMTETEAERYLANVDMVTRQIFTGISIPESMSGLDFDGANRIERALEAEYTAADDLLAQKEDMIDRTRFAFIFSGEFESGETL